VNSLAHWLGDAPYDDARTPRDHFITALVTIGEGWDNKYPLVDHLLISIFRYHNFHHTFPSDYRNGIGFFSYDPTKWFIAFCSFFGLAYQLKKFPENEINKGKYAMQLKKLDSKLNNQKSNAHVANSTGVDFKSSIQWPRDSNDLPILSWDECKTNSLSRYPTKLIYPSIHH
jgi:stearoyl-CoA desaturase (Delta-9 desaturase)